MRYKSKSSIARRIALPRGGTPSGRSVVLFGEMLRKARETRGVRLDLVTAKTRIPRHFLEALERSDLSSLPGGAFDKGYIRTIAGLLEIDPGPILQAYGTEERRLGRGTRESEDRLLRELYSLVPENKKRRSPLFRRPWLSIAIVASVALGSMAAAGVFLSASRNPPASPRHAESVPLPAPGPEPVPERQPSRAAQPPPALAPSVGLTVSGSGVGTGVIDRTLTGRADRFAAGTRVLFWTRVVGGRSGQMLRHIWLHEGRAVMRTRLDIGGPHWRTFSALTLPKDAAGPWTVEARGPDGSLLARQDFLCLPASQ